MVERRIVSVLFADVVGFTALADGLDPEDLATVQEAYFGAVRETLERYGGVLEKFIGDAAVALFGVPRSREDDAERAVRGALALHGAVSTLSAQLGLEPGTLLIRVGVNTGEVAYEPEATRVTGDAVNVAARLQAAAPPGRVVIGPDTALAVEEAFELEPVGGMDLKGKAEDVQGYVVAGVRASRSREAALGRLRARTVGRREEIDGLLADLDVSHEHGRWVLCVAPPGVGKSRLVRELLRAVRATPGHVRVLTARCTTEAGHPFAPIADLLRESLRSAGLDIGHGLEREAAAAAPLLQERLGAAGIAGRDRVVEQATALLAGRATVEAEDRAARFAAWRTAFRVLEDGVPTVWVVEDVHDASLDVLAFLSDAVSPEVEGRLLVLTGRPAILGLDPSWGVRADGPDADGRLLHLEPLGDDAAAELVRELVGDALPPELVARIASVSDGNPLFVEELLRTWSILGVLRDTYDGLELAAHPDEVPVPSTVQVLYAAQLDDLPPDARVSAQRAAVIGRRFGIRGVRELAGDVVDAGLPALVGRALVEGPAPDPIAEAYRFRHAVLRDAAYRTLPRNERARLHILIAGSLEEQAGSPGDGASAFGGVDAPPDVIAHHYTAALDAATRLQARLGDLARDEVADRARTWHRRAARHALSSSAFEAARRHAEMLLELLATEPDDDPRRAEAAELLGRAASNTDLELGAGWLEDALDRYEAILAGATDDAGRATAAEGHARTSGLLVRIRYDQVRFDEAMERAERSLVLVDGLLDRVKVMRLRLAALNARAAMSDAVDAEDVEREVAALAAEAIAMGDDELRYEAGALASVYGAPLSMTEELATWQEQSELAERLGRWGDLLMEGRRLVGLLMERDTRAALERARELPVLARSYGLTEAEPFAMYAQVEAAAAAGAWDEVLETGAAAFDLAERVNADRAWVRTSFALLPVAAARGDQVLVERVVQRHEEMRPEHPTLSSFARTVLTGVRLFGGLPPRDGDEPSRDDLAAAFPTMPSLAASVEMILATWLRTGRIDDATHVVEGAPELPEVRTEPTFSAASWHLCNAWVALARGDRTTAATSARAAIAAAEACHAPWWEARAHRVLEALGEADATAIERRVRLEMGLGVEHPQPPPVLPDQA